LHIGIPSNFLLELQDLNNDNVQQIKNDEKDDSSDGEDQTKECKEKAFPNYTNFNNNPSPLTRSNEPGKFTNTNHKDFTVSKIFDFKSNFKEDYCKNKNSDVNSNSKSSKVKRLPFEKNFRIITRSDKTTFSKKDTVEYKGHKIAITNSVLFFLNNYYKKTEYFKFNKKILRKPITVILTH